jgi:flagellar motor component MotA
MTTSVRRFGLILALLAVFVGALVTPVFAKPKNFVQRHPTMTAMAAGVGTTMYLKHQAAWKRAHGEKLNFAERHPYMSGIGVAVVTHHIIKKSTH